MLEAVLCMGVAGPLVCFDNSKYHSVVRFWCEVSCCVCFTEKFLVVVQPILSIETRHLDSHAIFELHFVRHFCKKLVSLVPKGQTELKAHNLLNSKYLVVEIPAEVCLFKVQHKYGTA